jgi:hypothetical protein
MSLAEDWEKCRALLSTEYTSEQLEVLQRIFYAGALSFKEYISKDEVPLHLQNELNEFVMNVFTEAITGYTK